MSTIAFVVAVIALTFEAIGVARYIALPVVRCPKVRALPVAKVRR